MTHVATALTFTSATFSHTHRPGDRGLITSALVAIGQIFKLFFSKKNGVPTCTNVELLFAKLTILSLTF